MYKVVIADDEVWIGFGIKKLIHRSGLPFEVVGEAPNGIKASDMVKQVKPDILITDIRMPGMNGLELMKKLLEEGYMLKVVFISGYAEFEYAKEALRMGAFDYLLKPVEEEGLTAILERYIEIREKKRKETDTEEEMDSSVRDSRVKKIIEEINQRYTEKISLGDLADGCGLSIGHLSTLIKKETGQSFSEYITGKRMEDAKKLLCREELSIDDIADMVGYHDYFYFTKAFKKYMGMSPSMYRKNL